VSWEASILAMGAALAVPLDEASLWIADARDPRAHELAQALRSKSRASRTRTLALALAAIARDIEALDLAEGA
jgi:hypothetical protein